MTGEKRSRLVRGCEAIVGSAGVISAPDELRVYDCDALIFHHRSIPDLVVLPISTQQVAQVVRLCASEGVPFLPRGAGTGLSGGATPSHGGVVIVLTRMTRILDLDIPNRMATVEAGCINLWLTNAARTHGFFYAPDPASQPACTIGGNVAENAGGPHCLKYGVTTNHVLGVTAVLPDGDVVRLGGRILDAPGYDLLGVFVGAEGTLGLCTEVTLRLTPQPEAVKTILAVFKTIEDASNAVSGIIARGIIPVALEMIDRETIKAVEANVKAGYPLDAGAVLLIELEGLRAEIEAEAVGVEAICREQGCLKVQTAKTEEERALLWKGRKEAAGSFGRIARQYFIQDAVVPRTKLPAVLREVEAIASRYGVRVANVFHAGDGNVHPMICYDRDIPGQLDLAMHANDEIMRCCIQAGGTVTGEHGIGLEKREYLRLMYTPADLAVMQRVRQVLDPAGLCNPGKIFPEDEPRAESREPRDERPVPHDPGPVLQAPIPKHEESLR
ncbi:MAG TPA: FAD-linked oxidase C-terminal domain-containing protein [Candidatus Methylomirabilis sp.]|nr:FAD-linked oxidase C-terminal domain-containing protein [Candidatus Methylomirabilis sp.]